MTRVSIFSIFVVLLLTLAFLAVVPQTGAANSQPLDRRFLGLWEGVDVNDGSPRIISITDGDADGVFEVVSHDSYWTLCQGDRGIERASGGVRADGVLATDGLVTCFETLVEVPVQQTYELSRRDNTLFATPHGTSLQPITLHRID